MPLDYRDPSGETIDLAAAAGPRRGPRRPGRLAGGQPRRPRRARHRRPPTTPSPTSATRCASRFDIVGFDPRGTGASAPGRLPHRRGARRVPRRRPGPRRPGRGRGVRRQARGLLRGLRRELRRARSATSPPSRRPATWTCCAPRSARTTAELPRLLLRHPLGRDVRRAVPGEGRPVRARRRHRPVADLRESTPQPGRRLPDRAASLRPGLRRRRRLLPRRHRRRRVSTGSASCSTRSTTSRCPPTRTATWRSATPSTGSCCRSTARRTGRSSTQGLEQALRRRRLHAAAALRLLRLARERRRYTDNSLEAIYAINCLDDPTSIAPDQVPQQLRRLREGRRRPSARSSPGAWSTAAACRCEPATSRSTIRAEGAAPIVVIGTTRDPATPYEGAVALADAARVRRPGQPRRRRPHRLQQGQRLHRRRRRGLPDRRHGPEGRARVLTALTVGVPPGHDAIRLHPDDRAERAAGAGASTPSPASARASTSR